MLRVPIPLDETGIGKCHCLPRDFVNYVLKSTAVIDIGRSTVPINDQTKVILRQTQLAPRSSDMRSDIASPSV